MYALNIFDRFLKKSLYTIPVSMSTVMFFNVDSPVAISEIRSIACAHHGLNLCFLFPQVYIPNFLTETRESNLTVVNL